MWFHYTMEYYSAIKNEDILSVASKWMELDNNNNNTEYPRYSPENSKAQQAEVPK